jgi:uncharacterized protein (TIGR03067 family)
MNRTALTALGLFVLTAMRAATVQGRRAMKMRVVTLSAVAVLALGFARAGDQPKDKFAELEGTWILVKMEIDGESYLETGEKWKLVIKDGMATFGAEDAAKVKPLLLAKMLNTSKRPKTITLPFGEMLTFYGIYEVEGDELRVCGVGVDTETEMNSEARRPKDLDTEEGLLLVFKRTNDQQ